MQNVLFFLLVELTLVLKYHHEYFRLIHSQGYQKFISVAGFLYHVNVHFDACICYLFRCFYIIFQFTSIH